jgi:hypothetical protein
MPVLIATGIAIAVALAEPLALLVPGTLLLIWIWPLLLRAVGWAIAKTRQRK